MKTFQSEKRRWRIKDGEAGCGIFSEGFLSVSDDREASVVGLQ